MKRVLFLAVLFLIPTLGYTQDVAKADKPAVKAEKPLPAKAVITAAQIKELKPDNLEAENAELRAQLLETRIQNGEAQLANLPAQIKEAKDQLVKVREAVKKLADAAREKSTAVFEAAGVPRDKIAEYDIKNLPDGGLELTLKTAPKAEDKKQ